MKYVKAFAGASGATLEDGVTRETLSEECRTAALAFMTGVAAGWDKRDVALWLLGPYARATRYATHGERVFAGGGASEPVAPDALEALLLRVRGQLLASLEKASLDLGSLEFTDEAVHRGLVRKLVDVDRHDAWVPVDRPRMRLRERLEALFTADWLNAPYDYVELFVCHRCEAVVFDAHAKRVGICGAHRLSGHLPTNDNAPLSDPYARLIGK